MSFPIWPTAFVARFTAVTAAFLNQLRTQIAAAIDGAGGGNYTPAAAVDIQGAGFSGDIGGQVAFRQDTTTLTDANHTIDVSKDTWTMTASLGTNRVWTLRALTNPTPRVGARLLVRTEFGGVAVISIRTDDPTPSELATITGPSAWALFEYTAAGWTTIAWGGAATYVA